MNVKELLSEIWTILKLYEMKIQSTIGVAVK